MLAMSIQSLMELSGPAELGLAERRDATLRAMDIWP